MSKKIHTIQSSDKVEFDEQVNLFLELGCELMDGSYQIIKGDDGVMYSQVITYENCEIEFHNNGKLSYFIRSKWENDEKDSLEIWWDRFGKKLGFGIIKKDLKNGVFFDFRYDTSYELKKYVDDELVLHEWYENFGTDSENIELYKKTYSQKLNNGQLHGIQFESYDNGQKEIERSYHYGKKNGRFTWWYENGKKELEEYFRLDLKQGQWTKWFENGNMEGQGSFLEGKKNGRCSWWYKNGQLKYSHLHIYGKIHGEDIRWYENGNKKEERFYDNGIKVGKWIYYYEDSRIKEEIRYENGKQVENTK